MPRDISILRLIVEGLTFFSAVLAYPMAPGQSATLANTLFNLTILTSSEACLMLSCPSQDLRGAQYCQQLNLGCTHCKPISSQRLPWSGILGCRGEWIDASENKSTLNKVRIDSFGKVAETVKMIHNAAPSKKGNRVIAKKKDGDDRGYTFASASQPS